MAALQCDICGGKLVMKAGGIAVCDSCGIEHSKDRLQEKIQEIKGTVKIDGPVQVDSVDFVIRAGKLEKYNGAATQIVIPDTVNEIGGGDHHRGEGAFNGCSGLSSVIIPNGVTSIGDGAFYGCKNLTSIIIPNSITYIGNSAFEGTGLTSVIIPDSVKIVGHSAFANCVNLIEIIINKNVTIKSHGIFGLLSNCPTLKNITLQCGVEISYSESFDGDSTTVSIIIPESIISLTNEQLELIVKALRLGDGSICPNRYSFNPKITANINNVCIQDLYSERFEQERALKLKAAQEAQVQQKTGCYIATAVYGSYDAPQVLVLRQYRDNRLSKTILGRTFICMYYQLSPPIARWMKGKERINKTAMRVIDCIVERIMNREDM